MDVTTTLKYIGPTVIYLDASGPNCRMAFFGRILSSLDPKELKRLRLVKMKQKVGLMERADKQERLKGMIHTMYMSI